jgi:membrane-bound lytic murein transglycosylase F
MKPILIKATMAAVVLLASASSAAGESMVTDRYDDTFRKYSQRFFGPGFDWRIFKAQAMAESNLKPDAKSWVGARGLMQLMPSTYKEIQTKNPEFKAVSDPEWNIAAGIYYDRQLWKQWTEQAGETDLHRFSLASYNAGRGTLLRAQDVARTKALDHEAWNSISSVAPDVPRWRHEETLTYIQRIEANLARMDPDGRVVK